MRITMNVMVHALHLASAATAHRRARSSGLTLVRQESVDCVVLAIAITATAPANDIAEQQRPQSVGHVVVTVEGCVHAAVSVVARLHDEKE